MNRIDWAPRAVRQILKLEAADQKSIRTGVETLRKFPGCPNIKRLVDQDSQYRLRVGRFRVFFDFDGAAHIVHIEQVRQRDEHTY